MKTLLALCAASTLTVSLGQTPLNAQSLHREAGPPPGSGAVPAPERRVGIISGRVVDSATSRPLSYIQVAVVGTRFGTVTRDDGGFTISGVPAGNYTIRATFIGRAPQSRTISVVDGQTVTVEFAMTTQAVQLDAIVATGYL